MDINPPQAGRGLVSVITPAHNAATTLPACVASVAAQGDIVKEHIVINDGSTDATAELLAELKPSHPKLRLLAQTHKGAGPARNAGIEAATGRYIAFLDSDDLWLPEKLNQQVQFMQATAAPFTYGAYHINHQQSGRVIATYNPPSSACHRTLLRSCPIGCLTAAFDQRRLGKRYMPTHGRGQDWALWLDLTRHGLIARRYPGVLATYHRSHQSLSARKLCKAWDMYRIYREVAGQPPLESLVLLFHHTLSRLGKP